MAKIDHSLKETGTNVLVSARKNARLPKTAAADFLNIDPRTLIKAESIPPTTEGANLVLRMSEVYQDSTLPDRYCSELCPVGVRCRAPLKVRDLAGAVLGLLKECGDIEAIRYRLMEIAEDGVIDKSEIGDFERIMGELLEMEQRIESLRLWAMQHQGWKERGRAA